MGRKRQYNISSTTYSYSTKLENEFLHSENNVIIKMIEIKIVLYTKHDLTS